MRTLMLKFERGLIFDMNKLDENEMLRFDEFERRFFYITERIIEEKFTLEYDSRFDATRNYDHSTRVKYSSTTPKVKSTSKATSKPKAAEKPKVLQHILAGLYKVIAAPLSALK
uniref:Uncharacterized protein n=1 Tax=Romanomermis culicivorax TaxID=13658 RepID=A0A915KUV2_ROMCU